MNPVALAALAAITLLPPAESADATAQPSPVLVTEVTCGWPDRTQAAILDKASELMPAALARQLERHHRTLLEGARRARREHATHVQGPFQEDGTAARLAASRARVTALIDGQRPMKEVVRELGVAAHLVADLTNPMRTAPDDPATAALAARFGAYVNDQRHKLRVVFPGYRHPLLEEDRVTAFGMSLADRSRSYLDDLIGSFRRYDAGEDPTALDERSVSFGIASLTYSRSVTDTARVWLHAWRQAHGDLSGLPYPLEEPTE